MKVAILTNYHLEQVGGAEEALDRLATLWQARHHDVTLFSSPARRQGSRRAWNPPYRYEPIRAPWSTRWGLGRYASVLKRAHAQQPIDLVVASDAYWPGHAARLFACETRVPYVLYSHGGDCMRGSRFLKRRVCRERMAAAVREASGIACISRYVRERLTQLAEPTGLVRDLPNGWPDEWRDAPPTVPLVAGRYIVALGRIVELKGFQTLLQAYAQARDRLSGVGLVIVGDGSYRRALVEQARQLGLDPLPALPVDPEQAPGVYLPGYIAGEAKRALVENAALGVCPSIREEPQGMVVMEMLCRGVPVLASNTGGLPDMIRPSENGDLFVAGDSRQLAAKLVEALASPVRLAAWSRAARLSVAQQTWSAVADRYLELFEEVLSRASQRGNSPAHTHAPHARWWRSSSVPATHDAEATND